ncbi:hypothetical protein HF086_000795 [Spodoptera exigua]|uniref:40S ribosomal protein S19-binding protein 1 n=1 Tax=Spodoptera exigua TaxID=7107 RepID=A0A922MQR6_SPOEX|nr:hypothetical protein HF086_000795 [Spodoptera exigua]
MSSALVRQALELVDQEDHRHLYKSKTKKAREPVKSKEQLSAENIDKLLKLSTRAADTSLADKIVERAIRRKPLADKEEVKQEEEKSILFPEGETFEDFEKELFCS